MNIDDLYHKPVMRHTVASKKAERDRLNADTEAFIKTGGKVHEIPTGRESRVSAFWTGCMRNQPNG
ncbi:hypothetical protein GCM10023116_43460 [Kistimonas scapharcae]|uniref:Transcriptional regulator SutA RNAP-binding domain-containing protein n=1 Tax=Kistimonas scapharcae TaxID=1036133 RepID=A0ABP8V848_9GAMM